MTERKKDILIIIILFFVAFLIRVVGISNVLLEWDEVRYWPYVFKIIANDWVPIPETFEGPSPFLSYIGAVVTMLFGGELNTLRMISAIFGSLTVPMLYLFGKAMYDRKTGTLAALFLCFSGYHCFYSRIFMLEAFALFFVTAFLYFFWLSQHSNNRKSMTYAMIAGGMLGLAIAAKYLPCYLVLVVLVYVLWTKGFKALRDKRIILILILALLLFSPMLICFSITNTNPIYYYAFYIPEIREKQPEGVAVRGVETAPSILFTKGVERMQEILAWGAKILILPWRVLFSISALLLFIITLLLYFPDFINRKKESSFLLISLLVLYTLLFGFVTVKYYLLYSFPFYFVMLSHLAIKSFEHLKKENNHKNIFRIFIISLTTIMLFSYFFTGVASPYWDKGEHSWIKSAVDYIKSDITNSGYKGHVLIGYISGEAFINYCMRLTDFNATTCNFKATYMYLERLDIDLEKINRRKPIYLIVSEAIYASLFKNNVKKEIYKDYRLVFHSETPYSYNGFVFKRKNIQSLELTSPVNSEGGKISQNVFKRSIPGVMKVGKRYTALVQVKNTRDSGGEFFVKVYSEGDAIFIEERLRKITLNKDSVKILKFKIVPFKEYVGELPIMVDLYASYEENETSRKVDSSIDYVYLIKK